MKKGKGIIVLDKEALEIIEGLKPLMKEARSKGLWFYTRSLGEWLTPDELEKENKEGKFLWGAVNWQLRFPEERLHELKMRRDAADAEYQRFKKKVEDSKKVEA